ncbi:MAG TPA: hypothetical protein VN373_00445, partial [Methanosarcina barkeri]|nr:hypothetical protein [Methanosarcina barkeri]
KKVDEKDEQELIWLTNRIPFSNIGPETNYDKQWAFEIAYFTQNIGTALRELGNLLNARD